MWGRLVVVSGILIASAVAHAEPKHVGLLPIRARWVPAADLVLINDVIGELGADLGVDVVSIDTDDDACWHDRACYQRAAHAAVGFVLVVEVVKTGSGRLHLTFLLLDPSTRDVRELGTVRSELGVLRARLRATIIAIRDAMPAPLALAFPSPRTDVPTPTAPTATEPPTPWYRALTVDAFISAAFTHNFNDHPAANGLRTFDDRPDSATIDVAELVIQRVVDNRGDAGFRLDLVAGSAIPRVSAAAGLFRDSTGTAGDFDLQQAYASYIAPLGRGLRVDAGKFVTPVGAEVIEGYDGFNMNYSHSFLFGYAIPFTHTGIRIGYPFDDRISATLLGYNGWDTVRDNNHALSMGAQLAVQPLTDLTLTVGYLGGAERPADDHTWRHLVDVIAAYRPNYELTFGVNADLARDGSLRWYGLAGYISVEPTRALSIGLRGEAFADPDGTRTGTAQHLWETTVTPALRLAPGFEVRLELRYDHSTQAVFSNAGGDRQSQLTTAANVIYAL